MTDIKKYEIKSYAVNGSGLMPLFGFAVFDYTHKLGKIYQDNKEAINNTSVIGGIISKDDTVESVMNWVDEQADDASISVIVIGYDRYNTDDESNKKYETIMDSIGDVKSDKIEQLKDVYQYRVAFARPASYWTNKG